jgi:hypothetical protein
MLHVILHIVANLTMTCRQQAQVLRKIENLHNRNCTDQLQPCDGMMMIGDLAL